MGAFVSGGLLWDWVSWVPASAGMTVGGVPLTPALSPKGEGVYCPPPLSFSVRPEPVLRLSKEEIEGRTDSRLSLTLELGLG